MADQKSPDWLPSGWTMELKVRRDGRKDKYYNDPVSGYVFRSMKDVLRYVKTGELGRLASKPKDKGNSHMELEDDKLSSPVVAEDQNLAESGINRQIIENQSLKPVGVVKEEQNQSLKPVGVVKEEQHQSLKPVGVVKEEQKPVGVVKEEQNRSLKPVGVVKEEQNQSLKPVVVKEEQNLESTCTGDCIPLSEHTSDQCREGAAVNSVDLPGSKDLKQGGASSDSTISSVSADVVGALPEKQQREDGIGRHRSRKKLLGLNKMKEPQLPRRASKRLAGIVVDPPADLITNKRARQVAARRSDEADPSTSENLGKVTTQEEHAGKEEADNKPDKERECPLVLPPKNPSIPEEHVGLLETDDNANEKPGSPTYLYSDPCIDFAIKTLTGAIPIEDENKADGNPCPNPIGDENKADENPGCRVDSWMDPCIEFARKIHTGAIPIGHENKAEDNMELSYGDLCTDPCIEFAVKTLIGAIPVGDDLCVQNYFQQPSSSETQGANGLKLQNVGLDFRDADILCQQSEKPLLKQQESVTSNLTNSGNVSLQNSGGGGRHQHVEGRSEQCSRQTML
ncbi:methyl-CpG-binding domain-containing protein 13 [Cornus florida]|uniref:methyl-CpG-binding domain-containing protein 13 n=1 Tax=Cornus florida TaxID=4283 RepID=UPI0028A23797|nr:methyl-CpG-binding domain-containing protein 13 [Cornus florida]